MRACFCQRTPYTVPIKTFGKFWNPLDSNITCWQRLERALINYRYFSLCKRARQNALNTNNRLDFSRAGAFLSIPINRLTGEQPLALSATIRSPLRQRYLIPRHLTCEQRYSTKTKHSGTIDVIPMTFKQQSRGEMDDLGIALTMLLIRWRPCPKSGSTRDLLLCLMYIKS